MSRPKGSKNKKTLARAKLKPKKSTVRVRACSTVWRDREGAYWILKEWLSESSKRVSVYRFERLYKFNVMREESYASDTEAEAWAVKQGWRRLR